MQTETSEVSTLISGEQVSQLATNGRNITSLAALGLGVSNTLPPFGGVNALTSANGISFNGSRSTHNIYMIDGGEQNDRGCGGCFMNLPSQDAIAQFQTLDSNYKPDYGIGSGGTILMVLKSGSTKYHGEVYYFNRNTAYNANDYFLNAAGKPRSKFQLNIPGGNIGGPLWIPHVYNEVENPHLLLLERRVATADSGQRAFVSRTPSWRPTSRPPGPIWHTHRPREWRPSCRPSTIRPSLLCLQPMA